jgi:hypothetical protein
MKGPNNNTIMILAGFDEIGILKGVKTITNPDLLKQLPLENVKNLPTPFHFQLVIEAEGFRRTDFGGEIKFFELLR